MKTINLHALGDVIALANTLHNCTLTTGGRTMPARCDYYGTRTADYVRVTAIDGSDRTLVPVGNAVRIITQKRSQFLARS